MTDPAETIRRCDEGLAKLWADYGTGSKRRARIKILERVRAQAVKDLERAERARRLDPWKST